LPPEVLQSISIKVINLIILAFCLRIYLRI
jgi:hypothetical protein